MSDSSTIVEEVAREVGVSVGTVYRALRAGDYRRPTFQHRANRIRTLLHERGYQPNTAARAMRSGQFGSIGLLLGTRHGTSRLPQGMLEGVHDALAEEGYTLAIVRLPDAQLTDADTMPGLLRERRCDGLLIDYTHAVPPAMERLVESHQLPAVWLNVNRENDAVRPDDEGAGRQAVEHLLSRGRTRFIYVGQPPQTRQKWPKHYSEAARKEAVLVSAKKSGIDVRLVEHADAHARCAVLEQLIRDGFDGVVAYGPDLATEALFAAERAGSRPQRDVDLIYFGTPAWLGDAFLPCLQTPQAAVGRTAVAMLLAKLAGGPSVSTRREPFDLILPIPEEQP